MPQTEDSQESSNPRVISSATREDAPYQVTLILSTATLSDSTLLSLSNKVLVAICLASTILLIKIPPTGLHLDALSPL